MPPDDVLERRLGALEGRVVVGVDESGRGPWAGPVVAAAAWLPPGALPPSLLGRLDDCKVLRRELRGELYQALAERARIAVGVAEVGEIDRLNILNASLLAMTRAVEALGLAADIALVDGNRAPALPCPCETVIGGDGRCLSIAAASIVAKVTRDRRMAVLAERYPGYGWERNQGYGTPEHRAALTRLGPSAEHRRSFRPVREAISITL